MSTTYTKSNGLSATFDSEEYRCQQGHYEQGKWPYDHAHCSSCGSWLYFQSPDGDLPSNANVCTCGAPKCADCECGRPNASDDPKVSRRINLQHDAAQVIQDLLNEQDDCEVAESLAVCNKIVEALVIAGIQKKDRIKAARQAEAA